MPPRQPLDTWRLLETLTSVLAPPTLAAALLYWFGLELTRARLSYFGVGLSTLGYSTTDYLIRGVEAGIVPLIALSLAVLVTVVAYTAASRLVRSTCGAAWFRPVVWAVVAVSAGVTAAGVYAVFRPLPEPFHHYLLPSVLLAAGPLVGFYAVGLQRPPGEPMPASARVGGMAVTALVVLSVFWGTSRYAVALGHGRAQDLEERLSEQPGVVLYSAGSLGIDPALAPAEIPSGQPDGRYSLRYTGLRLLIRSDDKYFLLPDHWTREAGSVLVIPDTPDIRVEFSPGESP